MLLPEHQLDLEIPAGTETLDAVKMATYSEILTSEHAVSKWLMSAKRQGSPPQASTPPVTHPDTKPFQAAACRTTGLNLGKQLACKMQL